MRPFLVLLFLPSLLFSQTQRPFDLGEYVYNSFEFFGAGYIVPGPTLTSANAAHHRIKKVIAIRDTFMGDPKLSVNWYQILLDSTGHCTDFLAGTDNYHYEYDKVLRQKGIYRLSLICYQAFDAGEALTPDSVLLKYDNTGRPIEVENYSNRLTSNFISPAYDDIFISYLDSGNFSFARATGMVGNWLWEYKYNKDDQVLSFERPSYNSSYGAKQFYHHELSFAPLPKKKKKGTAEPLGLRNGLDLLDTIPVLGIFTELFLPADSFAFVRDSLHRLIIIRGRKETRCMFTYDVITGLPVKASVDFGDENHYGLIYRYEYYQ